MTREPDTQKRATMPAIEIEPGSDPEPGCPCCDPDAARPQGFVTRDGEALALYFTDGALEGPVSAVELTISLGRWDADSGPVDRRTAHVRLTRTAGGQLDITLLDASLSRWHVLAMLGHMLDASVLGTDPERETFLRVAETIATNDPRLAAALADRTPTTARLSLGRTRRAKGFSAREG